LKFAWLMDGMGEAPLNFGNGTKNGSKNLRQKQSS